VHPHGITAALDVRSCELFLRDPGALMADPCAVGSLLTWLMVRPPALGHEIAAMGRLAKRHSAKSRIGKGEGSKRTAP
jgi:hypothetical protein